MFDDLPYELHSVIITRIPLYYLKEARKVNRESNDIIVPFLWKNLRKAIPISLVLKYGRFVQTIECSTDMRVYRKKIERCFPNLRVLYFPYSQNIGYEIDVLFGQSKIYEKYEIFKNEVKLYDPLLLNDTFAFITSFRNLELHLGEKELKENFKLILKKNKKLRNLYIPQNLQRDWVFKLLNTKKIYLDLYFGVDFDMITYDLSFYGLNLHSMQALPINVRYYYMNALTLNKAGTYIITDIYNRCINLKILKCTSISDPDETKLTNNHVHLKHLYFQCYKYNPESQFTLPDVIFISTVKSTSILPSFKRFPKLSILKLSRHDYTPNILVEKIQTLILDFKKNYDGYYSHILKYFPVLKNLVIVGGFFHNREFVELNTIIKSSNKDFKKILDKTMYYPRIVFIFNALRKIYKANKKIDIVFTLKFDGI